MLHTAELLAKGATRDPGKGALNTSGTVLCFGCINHRKLRIRSSSSKSRDISARCPPPQESTPSALSVMNYWVKTLQFDSCLRCGKSPVHSDTDRVPSHFPGGHFARHRIPIPKATLEALTTHHTQLNLRHVQPRAMFGRIHKLH